MALGRNQRGRCRGWPLYGALLSVAGCFMEGYAPYRDAGADAGSEMAAPAADGTAPAHDGDPERAVGEGRDAQTREPVADGEADGAMDAAAPNDDDSGLLGSDAELSLDGASPADAALSDGSASMPADAGRTDASIDAGGMSCIGQTTCAPPCNTSPCTIDCADAGTCNVICEGGRACSIDCGLAGTCNVTCQSGATCSTICNNIQFCPVDCQEGASCRNSCTTGVSCGFSTPCTRGYKACGPIAACGEDASC